MVLWSKFEALSSMPATHTHAILEAKEIKRNNRNGCLKTSEGIFSFQCPYISVNSINTVETTLLLF